MLNENLPDVYRQVRELVEAINHDRANFDAAVMRADYSAAAMYLQSMKNTAQRLQSGSLWVQD